MQTNLGTLIFTDFGLRSASAIFRTRENISMTPYDCVNQAELCATRI